jgi:large subunit ribosomal protein L10
MRAEKQFLLDELKEKITRSNGFIITQYDSMSAGKTREFRNSVAEVEGDLEVVKKRVFIKAAEAEGVILDPALFNGHIGILFANGEGTLLAKSVLKFQEQNKDNLTILGGRLDGETLAATDVIAVAKLPGIDELRAQLLGLLEAPQQQTVSVLNQALVSILYCLDEKCKKDS